MTSPIDTTLLIFRHGETQWNVQARYQGHGDSPLTGTGRRQADALGRRMKTMAFDTLLSSDLGRARETAAIIAGHTGHRVETDPRIRERNYGVLEGLTLPEITARHPAVLDRLNAGDPDYVIPGGESHRMHYQRNVALFEELPALRPGETTAVVGHGGVLDSVFRYVANLPLGHPRCFVAANAGLSVITHGAYYGTTRWVIKTWGDTGHLNGIDQFFGLA